MESWSKTFFFLNAVSLLNPRQRNQKGIKSQFFRQRNKPTNLPKTSLTHGIIEVGRDLWLSNPLHDANPVRAGCCVPCAVKIWVFSRLEIPQHLQAPLPITDHTLGEKFP